MKIIHGSLTELGIDERNAGDGYIAAVAKKMKEFDPDGRKAFKLAEKYRKREGGSDEE